MKVKQLIKKLSKMDPKADVIITNEMGCPAYDYEGQKFKASFKAGKITIVSEIIQVDRHKVWL